MANNNLVETKVESRGTNNQCDCSKALGLYSVILWCCCALGIMIGGYSLYRQQFLEDRLILLEEQQAALRAAVMVPVQHERLRKPLMHRNTRSLLRPARDADCLCPQGRCCFT